MPKILKIIISITIAELFGIIGSVFTMSSIPTWYTSLVKPSWNPPSWLFGPVWTTLYALMGVASYLVWQERNRSKSAKMALFVYGVHLALNAIWSIIFFGLQNPGLALAEILFLLISIIVTMVLFWRINHWATYLMVPYLLWVCFATFLNFTIWRLN
jgi:tryptophan-rich sensory protein